MDGVTIGLAKVKGKGIFAARDFSAGEFLFGTTGRVVPDQTEHSYQVGFGRHVEPDPPARYINHSCNPNAGVRTNKQTGFPDFYAMWDIKKGEEITIDYAMTEFTHYPRADPKDEFDLTCHCGSAGCRGKFGYYSELSEQLKKKYAGFISDYLIRWEQQRSRST